MNTSALKPLHCGRVAAFSGVLALFLAFPFLGVDGGGFSPHEDSNLVDSASSHTLVSKIKPCMSKYKRLYTVKLRMAHYISYSLFDSPLLHGYP